VSAEMAVKLASALNTSAQFWLNAQQAIDIYNAIKNIRASIILPKLIFQYWLV